MIKSKDERLECVDLKTVCEMLAQSCRTIGIEIVRHLDPVEYGKFLKEREVILTERRAQLDEKKEAKVAK